MGWANLRGYMQSYVQNHGNEKGEAGASPLVCRVPKNRALTPLNLNQQSVSQFNYYIYCFYLAECFFILIVYIRAFTVPIYKSIIYQWVIKSPLLFHMVDRGVLVTIFHGDLICVTKSARKISGPIDPDHANLLRGMPNFCRRSHRHLRLMPSFFASCVSLIES